MNDNIASKEAEEQGRIQAERTAHGIAAQAHEDAACALYSAGFTIHRGGVNPNGGDGINCDICGSFAIKEDIRVDQYDNTVCTICKVNDAMEIATKTAEIATGNQRATIASKTAELANGAVLANITVDACILAMVTHSTAAGKHILAAEQNE